MTRVVKKFQALWLERIPLHGSWLPPQRPDHRPGLAVLVGAVSVFVIDHAGIGLGVQRSTSLNRACTAAARSPHAFTASVMDTSWPAFSAREPTHGRVPHGRTAPARSGSSIRAESCARSARNTSRIQSVATFRDPRHHATWRCSRRPDR